MAGGAPRRLTDATAGLELFPSWSRDGRQITFIGWSDAGLGEVRVVAASGGAARSTIFASLIAARLTSSLVVIGRSPVARLGADAV